MASRKSRILPPNQLLFCNTCKTKTNHMCEADHCHIISLQENERTGYRLWICAGCETGTLERYIINAIFKEDDPYICYYPDRNSYHVEEKNFKKLPTKLGGLYRETLRAYNNRLIILSAVGIRALLEGICADKQIAGRDLRQKIDNMKTILPGNIVTNLHNLRFIGNEAAHELSAPKSDELRLAIEISEDLLNFLYELDYKASLLAEKRKSASPTT